MDADLRKKLDEIDGNASWAGEAASEIPPLLGDDGPIATEIRALYERLDTIARQLDDVLELLRGDK